MRVGSGFRRASFVVVLAGVFSAAAFAQKTFSFPHVLETSGRIAGIGWSLKGGQFTVDTMPPTTDKTYTTFEPIEALFSLYGNDDIYKWLIGNVGGVETPLDFDIYSLAKDDTVMMSAFQMEVDQIDLPGCDVDDHDPAGMRIRMYSAAREATTRARSVSSFKAGADLAKKQKMFLPSNFRLSLGDLPCGRVSKVDGFSVKCKIIEHQVSTLVKDGSFHIPVADAPAFQEQFRASLSGTPKELPFRLDYLDSDGNILLSVMMNVSIISVAPSDVFFDPTDASATMRVGWHSKGHVVLLK